MGPDPFESVVIDSVAERVLAPQGSYPVASVPFLSSRT